MSSPTPPFRMSAIDLTTKPIMTAREYFAGTRFRYAHKRASPDTRGIRLQQVDRAFINLKSGCVGDSMATDFQQLSQRPGQEQYIRNLRFNYLQQLWSAALQLRTSCGAYLSHHSKEEEENEAFSASEEIALDPVIGLLQASHSFVIPERYRTVLKLSRQADEFFRLLDNYSAPHFAAQDMRFPECSRELMYIKVDRHSPGDRWTIDEERKLMSMSAFQRWRYGRQDAPKLSEM